MAADEPAGATGPPPAKALDEKLDTLPGRPGVYLLKDTRGTVIYVGKARSLRGRVRTYFRGGDERSQVAFLMHRVADFDSLVTATEKEALILENNLINAQDRQGRQPLLRSLPLGVERPRDPRHAAQSRPAADLQ
jgi:hypothetical protein